MEPKETSKNLPEKSEKKTQIFKSVALAFERVNIIALDGIISDISKDIESEFKDVPIEKIQEAIKKGSLGYYGRTYRMSSQEVCIWIREHRQSTNYSNLFKA